MLDSLVISSHLPLHQAIQLSAGPIDIRLADESRQAVIKCKEYLDQRMARQEDPIYGVNTGFGSLCNVVVGKESLGQLQLNLVRSHACGMGDQVPDHLVRLMLLFKIKGLSLGHSGVALATVEALMALLRHDILPDVRTLGSLGASGDLAPLAHLSLAILGEGKVRCKGVEMEAAEALASYGIEPIRLEAKEGLALLNGTQFMSAYGSYIADRAASLVETWTKVAAMSLEAYDGRAEPFDHDLHRIRGHEGQTVIADRILTAVADSALVHCAKAHVQDPYSFRCIPQVLGASWEAIQDCLRIFQVEIDSVTDNPTIFPDEDKILSGGNFHGQPLALALDRLAIALAEIGSISERRMYKLLDGTRGLPSFLVAEPGINSGFMILQYTAASIVSQNKQLCSPASIDTIDSSQGQEDHVSMGANAATKAYRVLENIERLLALEWIFAAQAIEMRGVEKAGESSKKMHARLREVVPFAESDLRSYELMDAALALVRRYTD